MNVLAIWAGALALLALSAAWAQAQEAAPLPVEPKDRWENLGVPVRRSRIYSQTVGRDTAGREVLYFGFSDSKVFVLALDPRTGKGKQLDLLGNGELSWRVTGLRLERVEKMPGLPILQLADGTRIFAYDRAGPEREYLLVAPDGQRSTIPFDYTSSGAPLWDLIDGPDGRIYGNTHTPITLFAFDPATGKTHVHGDPVGHAGQIYSWMWHKGRLHMAAYSECTYTVWDPARPWNFGTEPEHNPRRIGKTSRHVQRAQGMMLAPDGQHVLVGGVPGYGRVSGGLAIVDPDAAQFEIVERPVEPHSPWTLATTPDPSVIVIGTSTYGGSGTKQALTPGRLVFWDWQRRQKASELTPWDDEIFICSLLRVGNELWVCGAPKGKVAVYDFTAGRIVHTADYGYGAGRLKRREADGKIYAAMRGRLVRIDPATRRHEVLGTYPDLHAAIAFAGNCLYGFAGTHLIRFKLK